MVKGYSTTQVLVRDATSNDASNPSFELLYELAQRSFDSVDFFEIMDMLDKRLNDKGKYWRHVAKSLTVLDYLVRFGSENCVLWCKENLYIIKTLREFRHEDDGGADQGQIIRVKAKELTSLLLDEERLKEERTINLKNRRDGDMKGRRRRRGTRNGRGNDEDQDELQRALEESRLTAEEDERRRRQMAQYDDQDPDLQTALQLSKEEEELKKLQEMQRLQQLQQQQGQMNQPQGYFDIFGNPISPDEYLQFQQQQDAFAQQQLLQQQQLEQQRQAEQQYLAMQQQQQQQQQAALAAQQTALANQNAYYQQPLQTGSNNPFAMNNFNNKPAVESTQAYTASAPQLNQQPAQQQPQQQPLKQTRTGNQSITDKYSQLNTLLATGTGIDTFGNTGEQRIPAQHTQTGTFINSQGTGYRQVTNDPKNNPFLNSQYTGLPSTNIVSTQTGYGFGNAPSQQQQQQQKQQQRPDQGFSLIDL